MTYQLQTSVVSLVLPALVSLDYAAEISGFAPGWKWTAHRIKGSNTVTGENPLLYSESNEYHEVFNLEEDTDNDLYSDEWLFADDEDQDGSESLGEQIAHGKAIVCIPNVASQSECQTLLEAGLSAAKENTGARRGRSRFSVSDPNVFTSDIVLMAEEILLRTMDYLDENIPSIYGTLFKPTPNWVLFQPLDAQLEERTVPPPDYLQETCESIRELYMMGELEWSEGEPAINIYEADGYFGAHKDHLALTILIPLTSPAADFEGGGTGFWAGNRNVDESPQTEPSTIIKPIPGSALIFGGDVTHAGMQVESGYRSVLVCSFSTRTEASPEDRLHGLQAPPTVTANFKGTN